MLKDKVSKSQETKYDDIIDKLYEEKLLMMPIQKLYSSKL